MGAEGALDLVAINHLRSGPAFWRGKNDHRPARTFVRAAGKIAKSCVMLDLLDLCDHGIECGHHRCVHQDRIGSLDKVRRPTIAAKQLLQLFAGDAREHGGIGDLVAVQVQYWQHCAVRGGVQKFVGMPRSRQRPGFSFAIADHAGCNQIRIVEYRTEGMAKRITEFATFMYRARTLW